MHSTLTGAAELGHLQQHVLHKLLLCSEPDCGTSQGLGKFILVRRLQCHCPGMVSLCSLCAARLSDLVAFFRHSALASLQKPLHTLLTLLLSSPLIKIKLYMMHTAYFAVKATCFPLLLSGAFDAGAIYLAC